MLVLLALAVGFGSESVAQESPDLQAARAPIESFYAELPYCMKHSEELGFDGRRDRLRPVLQDAYDLKMMSAMAIGQVWRNLSDDQKSRWTDAFGRMTIATYARRFAGYSGERLIVNESVPSSRGTVVVHSELALRRSEYSSALDREGFEWWVASLLEKSR